MHRMGTWKYKAVLLAALALTASAMAEPSDTEKPASSSGIGNWFSRWFGHSEKAGDKKTSSRSEKKAPASAPAKKPAAPGSPLAAEQEQGQEWANYFRRLGVCDRLQEIAEDTCDDELLRRVEQLVMRVNEAHLQRQKRLTAGNTPVEPDEHVLEKHLGPRDSVKNRRSKLRPTSDQTSDRKGRIEAKED